MSKILTFVIFLSLMNCNSTHNIDVQGHRGCRGLMPENTLPAFEKAISLGVNTLELDLVITKDRKVLVSHEPYMNSAICLDEFGNNIPENKELSYNIYQMDFSEIKTFDCGTKGYPRFSEQQKIKTYKPLLSEVFEMVKTKNIQVKFNIEIKTEPRYDDIFTPKPEEFVKLVLQVVNANNAFDFTNLQSFDLRVLEEIKKQSPKMKVALLVDENEDILNKLSRLSIKPEIISPYYKLLNAENISKLKKQDFKIIPWTVNSDKDLHQIIDLNVDGIITDYPDRLIKILNL